MPPTPPRASVLQVDQRHGLTECAAERLASILTSSTAPSQAELGGHEAAGDPDAAASFAAATHAAASLNGPTKAAPSSASPAEPRAPTASPDGARLDPEWGIDPEWGRLATAALAAATLAHPVKEWSTPWRAPVLYSPAMAPVALAVDAAIDTATGGQQP